MLQVFLFAIICSCFGSLQMFAKAPVYSEKEVERDELFHHPDIQDDAFETLRPIG